MYYTAAKADFDRLNEIVGTLDDARSGGLVCREGGWGPWVNCGAWCEIDGFPVDLILRDTRLKHSKRNPTVTANASLPFLKIRKIALHK